MSKKKIFISFDFNNDTALKNEFVGLSQKDDAPFKVANWSLNPKSIDKKWMKESKYHLSRCDMLLILVGEHTQHMPGVKKEVEIAKGLGINTAQILSHPQYTPIPDVEIATEDDLVKP